MTPYHHASLHTACLCKYHLKYDLMFKITFKLNRSQQILILMFEGQGQKNSHAVGLEVFIHHETLVKMKKNPNILLLPVYHVWPTGRAPYRALHHVLSTGRTPKWALYCALSTIRLCSGLQICGL